MNFLLNRFEKINHPLEILEENQILALNNFKNKITDNHYQFEEVPCLCGQNHSILISPIDRYGLSVPTRLCRNCGLMWTSKRLTQPSLEKFYQEDYRAIYVGNPQAPESFFNNQVEQGKRIYEFVKSHLELERRENLTVFEIGCGAGGILMPFKLANCSVFGCDLGAEYLQKGREKGLVLEEGEAEVLSKYGKADLVILSHVLEHFPVPLSSLNEITKLLKDDGCIYIEVPGILNIHRSYKDILLFLQNAHLYHFTLTSLIYFMNQANFQLVKGNQYIQALFQVRKTTELSQTTNKKESFWKILIYLYWVELERRFHFWEIQQKIWAKMMKKIRNVLGDKLIDDVKTKLAK
jgi:SAM-dependent methyltransferase